jgi:hypothetical protein
LQRHAAGILQVPCILAERLGGGDLLVEFFDLGQRRVEFSIASSICWSALARCCCTRPQPVQRFRDVDGSFDHQIFETVALRRHRQIGDRRFQRAHPVGNGRFRPVLPIALDNVSK